MLLMAPIVAKPYYAAQPISRTPDCNCGARR